jgi:cytoskeleton protein RodZ
MIGKPEQPAALPYGEGSKPETAEERQAHAVLVSWSRITPPAVMTSIGDRLRQERLRRGLDIYQLADQTKINPSMLEAIEADDLEKLPGSFFTRSFVRQYVRALGLDEDEFEPELKRLTDDVEERPALEAEPLRADVPLPAAPEITRPRDPGRHPLGALLAFVAIVAVCSAIYGLWQRTRNVSGAGSDRTAHAVVKAPESPAPAPETKPQPPAPAETARTEPEPDASALQTPAAQPAETAPRTATAAPAPEQPPATPGEAGPIRVQVHATGAVWVRMIADGKVLYEGTLAPNESRTFDGEAAMNLRVGDPAATEVTWNGKPIGEIGPVGQPRTVKFTTGAFRVVTPAPPKPPVQNDGL